jgi:flagellar biosynthesis GTPase FlhF
MKDLEKLARTIRSLPGYECVKQTRGAHGGGAWLVRKDGKLLMRFTAVNASALTLHKIKQDLRRHGVPFEATKEEVKRMATVTGDARQQTAALVARIRARLVALGGDDTDTRRELAGRAVEIIEFRKQQGMDDVQQFGSTGQGKSPPRDVARESLRGLLDKDFAATTKSLARWEAVLDALDVQDGEISQAATDVIDSVSEQPEPETEPVEPEPVVPPGPTPEPLEGPLAPPQPVPPVQDELREAIERAELAEGVVEEIEMERDDARSDRDRVVVEARKAQEELAEASKARLEAEHARAEAEKERDSLRGQLAEAEKAATKNADKELKKQVRDLAEQLRTANRRVGQATSVATKQRRKVERLSNDLDATREALTEMTDRLLAEKQEAVEKAALAESVADAAKSFADKMASDLEEVRATYERMLATVRSELEDSQAMLAGWEAEASADNFKLKALSALADRILAVDGSAY